MLFGGDIFKIKCSMFAKTVTVSQGKEVEVGLKKLGEVGAEIYYSRFNILEALWVAANLMKNQSFDMKRFDLGLRSIMRGDRYRKIEEDHQIFKEALELYRMDHKDMIDNILYASSTNLKLKFLTLDSELREFVKNKGLKDVLVSPSQIE